jgi:hypothetical protein
VIVAGIIGAALGSGSYLFRAPHEATIQESAQTLVPQLAVTAVFPLLPQAVILTIALVTGLLVFAVAFLIVGTYLASRSKA